MKQKNEQRKISNSKKLNPKLWAKLKNENRLLLLLLLLLSFLILFFKIKI